MEVFLDGLYLVLNPKVEKEWSFKDYKGLKTKLEQLDTFIAECLKKIANKQSEKNKSDDSNAGYM